MDILILAGGLGTRLRSVVPDLPKAMVPIEGRPFLAHLLEQLKAQGFQRMCLAVGYRSQLIKEYFHDGADFDINLTYSEEPYPLGTGGAIKKAAESLPEEFLVLNGDSYLQIDFRKLIAFHTVNDAVITMALVTSLVSASYGKVELGENQRIIGFEEKGAEQGPGLINAGAYVVKKGIFDEFPNDVKISFESEILPRFVHKAMFGQIVEGFFIDIGTPESYERISKGLPGRMKNDCQV